MFKLAMRVFALASSHFFSLHPAGLYQFLYDLLARHENTIHTSVCIVNKK